MIMSFSGLYYGASICLVSFASGLSVVTLNIYYRGVRGGSVPTLIRTVVLNHLARFVFMRFEKAESKRTPQVCKYMFYYFLYRVSCDRMYIRVPEIILIKKFWFLVPYFFKHIQLRDGYGEFTKSSFCSIMSKTELFCLVLITHQSLVNLFCLRHFIKQQGRLLSSSVPTIRKKFKIKFLHTF